MKKAILLLFLWGCSTAKQPSLKINNLSDNDRKIAYRTRYDYHGLLTTNLWRDSLTTNQGVVLLNYSPLLDFEGITRAILLSGETLATSLKNPDSLNWIRGLIKLYNCDREYTASWYIKGKKLYLGEVTPRRIWIDSDQINFFDNRAPISQNIINQRIEKATGRKYKNGLLFADWVNGAIEGNIGGVKDSTQYNLVIINSPQKVRLEFKRGVLKKMNVTDVKKWNKR